MGIDAEHGPLVSRHGGTVVVRTDRRHPSDRAGADGGTNLFTGGVAPGMRNRLMKDLGDVNPAAPRGMSEPAQALALLGDRA